MNKLRLVKSAPELPKVYKTGQMLRVEQDHDGRDIRLLLIELINEHGSQASVAKILGVTQPTIDNWCDLLGIVTVTKTVAILSGAEVQPGKRQPATA